MRIFPRSPIPLLLSAPLGLIALWVGYRAVGAQDAYRHFIARNPQIADAMDAGAFSQLVQGFATVAWIFFAILLAGFLLGRMRRLWALSLLRKCYLSVYILYSLWFFGVMQFTAVPGSENIAVEAGVEPVDIFWWRWSMLMWPTLAVIFVAWLHVQAWRGVTIALYSGQSLRTAAPAKGDALLENLRSHGKSPRFRRSAYQAVFLHWLAIFGIPWLMSMWGCSLRYYVPHGGGDPVVQIVQVVQPKKKPKKKITFDYDSPIIFRRPDLDESKVLEEVDKDTQLTYQATPRRPGGQGKAKGRGWPEGVGDHPIRFVRLKYNGRDWDDGMDANSRADMNFLERFAEETGFKIAEKSESISISQLAQFDKGYAPPFVYMTGSAHIHLTSGEMKILREYLNEGGMLFADAGSHHFHRSFISLMNRMFPGAIRTIADDDPIYQFPYGFPDGAPPLWHHGGYQSYGVKKKNRWVVYYHPGDVNDAWKTGHSGMDRRLAERAYLLGINIIYYSFTNYLQETKEYRR